MEGDRFQKGACPEFLWKRGVLRLEGCSILFFADFCRSPAAGPNLGFRKHIWGERATWRINDLPMNCKYAWRAGSFSSCFVFMWGNVVDAALFAGYGNRINRKLNNGIDFLLIVSASSWTRGMDDFNSRKWCHTQGFLWIMATRCVNWKIYQHISVTCLRLKCVFFISCSVHPQPTETITKVTALVFKKVRNKETSETFKMCVRVSDKSIVCLLSVLKGIHWPWHLML